MAILCCVRNTLALREAVAAYPQREDKIHIEYTGESRWIAVLEGWSGISIQLVGITNEHYTDHLVLVDKPEISPEDFITAFS